jgi:hypothetical protein
MGMVAYYLQVSPEQVEAIKAIGSKPHLFPFRRKTYAPLASGRDGPYEK